MADTRRVRMNVGVPVEKNGTVQQFFKNREYEVPASLATSLTRDREDGAFAVYADETDATDSAKALAEERGIDLRSIEGTGEGGRVLKSDVEAAADA